MPPLQPSVDDSPHVVRPVSDDPAVPAEWVARVQALPGATLVHIPAAVRLRFAVAATEVWDGMAAGLPGWCTLAEGFFKLLLANIPEGMHAPEEVALRLGFWQRREYEDLLRRVEIHTASIRSGRRKRKIPAKAAESELPRSKAAAVVKMVAEGAYRKATMAMIAEGSILSPEDSRHWASALHPSASDAASVFTRRPVPSQPAAGGGPNQADAASPLAPTGMDPEAAGLTHPLRGVRFGALKAPGPSGMRPEHLAELLSVRRRTANKAIDALGRLLDTIMAGGLPEEARWITYSRTIFIRKKAGKAPRPLKIGEVLRGAAAKKILARNEPRLRRELAQRNQFGVAISGGAEALTHWRATLEEAIQAGDAAPMVVADLDMENFFNSIGWPAIRASAARHFADIVRVLDWEQRCAGQSFLGDQSAFTFDRGSEQGETLGPIKAVLPLADAREEAWFSEAARLGDHPNPGAAGISGDSDIDMFAAPPPPAQPKLLGDFIMDAWFMDDACVAAPPALFDAALRALDRSLAEKGVSRGRGADVKSTARIICPPATAAAWDALADQWATPYVRDTCKVLEPNAAVEYLGTMVGGPVESAASLVQSMRKTAAKRTAIAALDNPAAELILLRRVSDVANINYWLRCQGDRLDPATAQSFDAELRRAVEDTLGGAMPDASWWQAELSVARGGLGFRSAAESAPLAFVSSRVAARPIVADLFQRMEARGLGTAESYMRRYDQRTDNCLNRISAVMDPAKAAGVREILLAGATRARRGWAVTLDPTADPDGDSDDGTELVAQRHLGTAGAGIVADAGDEDPEHPLSRRRGPKLQRQLMGILDDWRSAGLREAARTPEAGGGFALKRLESLADPTVDHCWLWCVSDVHGNAIVDQDEFREAVRVRLGAGGPACAVTCEACGASVLDTDGRHASVCCTGEATRGHNRCVDILYSYAKSLDPATEHEPSDLVASQARLRPADLLTAAACRLTAVDVGVTSPAVAESGSAAMRAMDKRKRDERREICHELQEQGIHYTPMVMDHFGAIHPTLHQWLTKLARALARRKGFAAAALERQLRARLGAALARRAARMSLACWGKGAREPEVDVPNVNYEDFDLSTGAPALPPPALTMASASAAERSGEVPVRWGGDHAERKHGTEGALTRTYMRGAGDTPAPRVSWR